MSALCLFASDVMGERVRRMDRGQSTLASKKSTTSWDCCASSCNAKHRYTYRNAEVALICNALLGRKKVLLPSREIIHMREIHKPRTSLFGRLYRRARAYYKPPAYCDTQARVTVLAISKLLITSNKNKNSLLTVTI